MWYFRIKLKQLKMPEGTSLNQNKVDFYHLNIYSFNVQFFKWWFGILNQIWANGSLGVLTKSKLIYVACIEMEKPK